MRHLVRHRTASINEYSGRYSVMTDEFYLPEPVVIQPQAKDNKQGRAGALDTHNATGVRWMMDAAYNQSYEIYKVLLGEGRDDMNTIYDPYAENDPLFNEDFDGIAREMARSVLPVANYTELYWTQNLHNMMHLLKLRMDPHTQYETRMFAQAVYDLIKPLFPDALEAFDDYVREAETLSRMEVSLMRTLLSRLPINTYHKMVADHTAKTDVSWAKYIGMAPRELREFEEKWGLNPEPMMAIRKAPKCPECDDSDDTLKVPVGELKIKNGAVGKRLELAKPDKAKPKTKARRKAVPKKVKKTSVLSIRIRKGGVNDLPDVLPERPADPAPLYARDAGGPAYAPDGALMGWVGNEWLPVGPPAKSTMPPRVPRKK